MTPRALASVSLCALLAACHHGGGAAAPGDAGSDGGAIADAGFDAGTQVDAGPVQISVRSVFPAQGPAAGGTHVLVSGSGFVRGFADRGGATVSKQTAVAIGGAPASDIDVIDDNRLQLTVPPGGGGAADVKVTNPSGAGSCAGCFRYLAALSITTIVPQRGAAAGGTPVTVRGVGFTPSMLLLVGGRSLISLSVIDATTATGLTPPGAAGGADVLAATTDATGELRRGFVYQDPLAVLAVDPAVGPTAGGTRLGVTGAGFSAQAAVAIDGAPAATLWVDAQHLTATAPAHVASAVAVAVSDGQALSTDGGLPQASLPRGYLYADGLDGGAPLPLLLGSLRPTHGPLAGGTCPAACLSLFGTGLSAADLAVAIASAPVAAGALHVRSDTRLDVDLPAGAAAGAVDVAVTSAGATSTIAAADPGAFHYDPVLSVISISPASGAAAGGVAVAISGEGFAPGDRLRIGALDAASVVVAADGRSMAAIAPPGPPGPADVTVVATDADGHLRAATLPGGFTFTAPLRLLQVSPASGSQAGGTRVTLLGQGFAPGLSASVGGKAATALEIDSPSQATVRTPPGDPGAVAVSVALGVQGDSVPAAFTYFDPGSPQGGLSGGPLLGALNVTVFDNSGNAKGGVPAATVAVDLAGGARLSGLTDARGQVSFADERLVLPCQVTVTKALYNSITVGGVQTEDLSVFLNGPAQPPPPPPDPPPPPPAPQRPGTVSGHVRGFKVPPSLVLGPGQRLAARVAATTSSIYSAPPFGVLPKYLTVLTDGGTFSYTTFDLSPITLYALFGVEDQTTSPSVFTPMLMGILRRSGSPPNPDRPITDADITLDTHLDQSVTLSVAAVPSTPLGPVGHDVAVDLDLGNRGVIPLGHLVQAAPLDHVTFPHLPAASGQGFVFVDVVGLFVQNQVSLPASTYLRRVFSDPGPGLTLGPLLPFPVLTAPADQGTFAGTLWWTIDGPLLPNLVQVQVVGAGLQWSVVLPGEARSVVPPPEVTAQLAPGATYTWSVTLSLAPAFDYSHWIYDDLFSGSWTAYAFDVRNFKVAP